MVVEMRLALLATVCTKIGMKTDNIIMNMVFHCSSSIFCILYSNTIDDYNGLLYVQLPWCHNCRRNIHITKKDDKYCN